MKKFFYLVLLYTVVSCSGGFQKNMGIEELLAKENRMTVKEKKDFNNGYGEISITSEKEDTRSLEEIISNSAPPRYNVINTVFFKGWEIMEKNSSQYLKGNPYFEIQKIIKYGTQNIQFTLEAGITIQKNKYLSSQNPLEIELSDNPVLKIKNFKTYHQKTIHDDLKNKGKHDVIFIADIDIVQVEKLRSQSKDCTIKMNTQDDSFIFTLPKVFFEYLKEI